MGIPPSEMDKNQEETSDFERHRMILVPKTVVFIALGVILFLFLTFSGLLNRGYESKTISFLNVSLTSEGRGFGSKRLFIRKGQTITANYEVQVERGGGTFFSGFHSGLYYRPIFPRWLAIFLTCCWIENFRYLLYRRHLESLIRQKRYQAIRAVKVKGSHGDKCISGQKMRKHLIGHDQVAVIV